MHLFCLQKLNIHLWILQDKIRQWTKKQEQPWMVDVEADEKVDYGAIVPVIARLKELHVSMNLVIRPRPK